MTLFLLYKLYNYSISLYKVNLYLVVIEMLKNQAYQVREENKSLGGITTLLVFGALGIITSVTTITGGLSPLNVAIVACASFTGGIATFAASLIAYFFNGTAIEALPQICAMLSILGIRFVVTEIGQKKISAIKTALISCILMLGFGIGLLFLFNFTYTSLFLRISQAILCGCTTYFILLAVNSYRKELTIPISGIAGASLGVIYVLTLATLTSIDFASINFGRILGVLVMLLAIKKYKHLGGAVCGVLTSCGIILCSPTLGRSTMLLACAGLIAGLFAELGIVAVIISFITANIVGMIAIGISFDTFPMLLDSAIATVIFIVIPSSVWSQALQSVGVSRYSGEVIAQNAGERLNFAAQTINDVKESINKVSMAMEKKSAEQDLVSKVCENVCGKCKNNLLCWEDNFNETNDCFYKIETMLNLLGKVSFADFPTELNHCVKKNLLEYEFNTLYSEISYQSKLGQKLKEMRVMLSDQFSAMEEMLSSLSTQLTNYSTSDQNLSKKVTTYLSKHGIINSKVCVFINSYGSLTIEAYVPKILKFNDLDLCSDISNIVERELEMPRYSTVNGLTRIEMWEKPQYSIDIGASQLPGSRAEITGDSYELFVDNQGEAYIVLSDGMGSGRRAQLDSLLASSLISRLIRAGIGYSSAIRLINSSMRVKAWEESFATVDISIVNLYDGTLDIVKAGASATYLVRGDEFKKIEASSLPIGILQDIKPVKMNLKLKPNDVIINASDGVVEESLETLRQVVISNRSMSANDLAEKMIKSAKQFTIENHADDITIIVSKMCLNN